MTDLTRVARLCDIGFSSYDASYYSQIDEILADGEQTEQIEKARRLCAAGPTLTSPRFAYPHIKSVLRIE